MMKSILKTSILLIIIFTFVIAIGVVQPVEAQDSPTSGSEVFTMQGGASDDDSGDDTTTSVAEGDTITYGGDGCEPSSTCDASCPAGAECGSASGTGTTISSDCTTSQGSCTISCGSCPSDEQFCKEDEVWDRWWECNNYNCEEKTALNFDCNNLDGWYCTTDETSKEKRDYTCSCDGSSDSTSSGGSFDWGEGFDLFNSTEDDTSGEDDTGGGFSLPDLLSLNEDDTSSGSGGGGGGGGSVYGVTDSTGDGCNCTYDVVETVVCEDKHQDWSFSEYGDRTFCKEGGDGPGEECESIPIATDLTWNKKDHNYNSFQHGDFNYPYCSASVPPEVELDWTYHSQTDHSHSESHLQVSQANTDFSTTIIDVTLSSTSYTIDSLDLEFDENYYWRVKVTDENGHTSDWFNDEELSTTESFETDHRRSHPGFTWSPPSPQLEEEVTFTDTTTEGEFSVIDWSWEFEGGEPAQVEGSPKASTEFTGEIESREADLVVEDSDGVRCGITREVNLEPGLPDWEEEDPFSSLLFDFGLKGE